MTRRRFTPADEERARGRPVAGPLGVVASFTPWNGANVLSWRAVLSPIAAGNTVVVKPSELAPISAGLILAQIAEEAGFRVYDRERCAVAGVRPVQSCA